MSVAYFEIRLCKSCGLRYPLTAGHPFGARCPQCKGETRVVLRRNFAGENQPEGERRAGDSRDLAVILDNIRSAWNVGSILRSADGFGFARAYLCGITPTPEADAVRKTSLGAEEYVKWSHHQDAVKLVKRLKKQGWQIFALEEDARSESIARVKHSVRTALILGSEVTGVDPELLDLADKILYIPMGGQKRSFNVANAFSIAAYALINGGANC
jgi:tRNA G18 (ribose-2'-O)-methylase SpoU